MSKNGATINFAILGMAALRPMTGYEIKQVYERGPANFMPISYGQIYPILKKLAAEKLVVGKTEDGGRERQRYSITAEGRRVFNEWLKQHDSASATPLSHRELLLKLFFTPPAELGDASMRAQLEGFRRGEAQRLEHYRRTRSWLRTAHATNPHLPVWETVLDYGVGQSDARVKWAVRALAMISSKPQSKTKRNGNRQANRKK